MTYINISLYLAYGPLIYLFTLSITSYLKKLSIKNLLHFAPFTIFFIYMIFKYHFIGNATSVDDIYALSKIGIPVTVFIFLIIILFYILLSLIMLKRHNKSILENYSDIEKIKLFWLNILLLFSLTYCIITILAGILIVLKLEVSSLGIAAGFFIYLMFFGATFCVTYFSIRHPDIFLHQKIETKKSYENNFIDEADQELYIKKIITSMEIDQLFLDDSLTLNNYSEKIKLSPHLISMILNTCLNQNFYNFINEYRVEEIKKRLIDPQYKEHTILRIAFEAGFN